MSNVITRQRSGTSMDMRKKTEEVLVDENTLPAKTPSIKNSLNSHGIMKSTSVENQNRKMVDDGSQKETDTILINNNEQKSTKVGKSRRKRGRPKKNPNMSFSNDSMCKTAEHNVKYHSKTQSDNVPIISISLKPSFEIRDKIHNVHIQVPHPHDVLCGRGGGINSHPGNVTFRNWVRERKESYNLAKSKTKKADISLDIVKKVRSLKPPGRFLMRENNIAVRNGGNPICGTWIEIDESKAMAKTSQALREGAPTIRAMAKTNTNIEEEINKTSKSSSEGKSVLKQDSVSKARLNINNNDRPVQQVSRPVIVPMADGHRGKVLLPLPTLQKPDELKQGINTEKFCPLKYSKLVESQDVTQARTHQTGIKHTNSNEENVNTPNLMPIPGSPNEYGDNFPPLDLNNTSFDSTKIPMHVPKNMFDTDEKDRKTSEVEQLPSKNNSGLARSHSLAFSEISEYGLETQQDFSSLFDGDEYDRESNQFESKDSSNSGKDWVTHLHLLSQNVQSTPQLNTNQSQGCTVTPIQEILSEKTPSANRKLNVPPLLDHKQTELDEKNRQILNYTKIDDNELDQSTFCKETSMNKTKDLSVIPSFRSISSKSFLFEFPEIESDPIGCELHTESCRLDFNEGMKEVYDAIYPNFTSPRGGDKIPTHLIPLSSFITGQSTRFHIGNLRRSRLVSLPSKKLQNQ